MLVSHSILDKRLAVAIIFRKGQSSSEIRMISWHARMPLIVIACLAISIAGCDSKGDKFEIQGRVTFQGEPITEGKLLFLPVDQSRPQAVATISDGEYVTAEPGGVSVGRYKVQVFGYRKTGKVQDLGGLLGEQEEQEQYIPVEFNRETKLTVEISSEEREYHFDL